MPKFVLIFSVPENERGNVKGQIELETLQVKPFNMQILSG